MQLQPEYDLGPFETLLPSAPFREFHRRTVDAPIEAVWPHCHGVTAAEIRTLGPLFALRGLPAKLTGHRPPTASAPQPVLQVFAHEGFTILRRDEAPVDGRASIVFGAAGKFWSIRGNTPIPFENPAAFLDFDEPGFAKTVARLDAIDNGDGTTRIETETLVGGTDKVSTRKFRPYWAIIRLPSGAIRRSWLAAIDRRVARATGSAKSDKVSLRGLIPRRAAGLPPGQREVRDFPRFSDKPLRWAPPPTPIEFTISIEGTEVARFDATALAEFSRVEQVSDFHCVTTWTHRNARWGGVRFADVVRSVIDGDMPAYLVAHAGDRQSATFVVDDLLGDHLEQPVLLATELDGEPLDARHGAPLRLVSPGQYGYKNVKHLTGIDFCSTEPKSTLGPKEHLRARVDLEERHATLPNWLLRIPYRLTVIPTALAAERGLHKSPPE